MKKITKKIVTSEVLEDVICDICGNSCKQGEMIDVVGFEYATITVNWGYFSNKDGEKWSADICEDCVDTYLAPYIKFQKE